MWSLSKSWVNYNAFWFPGCKYWIVPQYKFSKIWNSIIGTFNEVHCGWFLILKSPRIYCKKCTVITSTHVTPERFIFDQGWTYSDTSSSLGAHSWHEGHACWCPFCRCGQRAMACVRHSSVTHSGFTALRVLCAPLSPPPAPRSYCFQLVALGDTFLTTHPTKRFYFV